MDLIVTHEHGDFDALASQVAVHKLLPEARPLLPTKLNRNARHFVRLYWDALPFVEAKDLPKESVAQVIVVDSQHVPSVRGVTKKTRVQVIDHHSAQKEFKPEWDVTLDEVGATATILTERIEATQVRLTPIEATLLLLGIYEDTGSLSYGTATARDAYAAAWLLDHGASLDIVREFLNHPLSDEQRELYEQLLENTIGLTIEGHNIVIATARAAGMVDEIATLAHKLRDLLDPTATFLLVDLGSHIQLVARSSVDAIDVGAIADSFGGGGHSRAAAAIVRGKSLEEAQETLIGAIREQARPSITVRDLMSNGVQTLPPRTAVREASETMRRTGYEGYPIVEAGRIVGLLTRRAVDRAMDHGLTGLTIDKIMEAGEVGVKPEDSVTALQQVMMTTGWGQVPVVGDDGKILGVVTRTDLIQHLGHTAPRPSRRAEIAERMEAALPPALMALVREVGRVADSLGLSLYVVGGFARDLLLDQPTSDMDFVVEGDAISLTHALQTAFGGESRSHGRFGTGKWMLDGAAWARIGEALNVSEIDAANLPSHIDFVTARTEYYRAPTALPDVERSGIKLDLHRRDFTINTLAIRLDPENFGQLLDFYGGEADVREGRIRVLHSLSFVDDPTRILRAARLEQRLGFHIEARTEELLVAAVPLLDRVSGDRIRHEIEFILAEREPEDTLCRLDALGVLRGIHPQLCCDEWTMSRFGELRVALEARPWPEIEGIDSELALFALLTYRLSAAAIRTVCNRLKVQRRTVESLSRIQRIRAAAPALMERLAPSRVDALLHDAEDRELITVWAAERDPQIRDHIADYARRLRHLAPRTGGNDLIARGLKPGPHFSHILKEIRSATLDGVIKTAQDEARFLDQLLLEEPH